MSWIKKNTPPYSPPTDVGGEVNRLRRFGVVMAAALGVVAGLLLWKDRGAAPYIAGVAAGFLLTGLVAPNLLKPVEKIWMAFAGILAGITTRVLVFLTFFIIITPFGLLRRLFRNDPLKLKFDRGVASYWVPVEKEGPCSRPEKPY